MSRKLVRETPATHKKYPQLTKCLIIIYTSSFCMTIIQLFSSHGELFSSFFFHDSLDTGMDFFHSIEYTRGRAPYDLFNTLYPPLANLFFYILYRFVPFWQSQRWANTFEGGIGARGTSIDLRVWQPTMMLFILFIISLSVICIILVQKMLVLLSYNNLAAICILFSYSILYAFERGNIVMLAMLCSLIFVLYKDSSNKLVSELALVALAISAGLKIYPALLGFLLLYDRQYKKALRTVLYGIIAFTLPCFVFHEGIGCIGKFISVLTSFSTVDSFSTLGYSFDRVVNSLVVLISQGTDIEYNKTFFVENLPKYNYFFTALVLLCGVCAKKKWQQVLSCCLSIIIIQAQGIYSLVFLIIPLLVFIQEEHVLTPINCLPFFAMTLPQVMLPQIKLHNKLLSMTNIRMQICIWTLVIYLLSLGFSNICIFFKEKYSDNEYKEKKDKRNKCGVKLFFKNLYGGKK